MGYIELRHSDRQEDDTTTGDVPKRFTHRGNQAMISKKRVEILMYSSI